MQDNSPKEIWNTAEKAFAALNNLLHVMSDPEKLAARLSKHGAAHEGLAIAVCDRFKDQYEHQASLQASSHFLERNQELMRRAGDGDYSSRLPQLFESVANIEAYATQAIEGAFAHGMQDLGRSITVAEQHVKDASRLWKRDAHAKAEAQAALARSQAASQALEGVHQGVSARMDSIHRALDGAWHDFEEHRQRRERDAARAERQAQDQARLQAGLAHVNDCLTHISQGRQAEARLGRNLEWLCQFLDKELLSAKSDTWGRALRSTIFPDNIVISQETMEQSLASRNPDAVNAHASRIRDYMAQPNDIALEDVAEAVRGIQMAVQETYRVMSSHRHGGCEITSVNLHMSDLTTVFDRIRQDLPLAEKGQELERQSDPRALQARKAELEAALSGRDPKGNQSRQR